MRNIFHRSLITALLIGNSIFVIAMQQEKACTINTQPFIDRKRLLRSIRAPYLNNQPSEQSNNQLKEVAQELFLNPEKGYLLLKEPMLIEKYKKAYAETTLIGQQKDNFIRTLLDQDKEFEQLHPPIEDRLALIGVQTNSTKKSVRIGESHNETLVDGGFISPSQLQMSMDKTFLFRSIIKKNKTIEEQLKKPIAVEKLQALSNDTLLGYYHNPTTHNENVFILEDKSIKPQEPKLTSNSPAPVNSNNPAPANTVSCQEMNEINTLLQKKAQRTAAIQLATQAPLYPWLEDEQKHLLAKIIDYSKQHGTIVTLEHPDILQATYFLANEYPALNLFLSITENKNPTMEKAKQELCTTPTYENTLGLSYYKLLDYLKNPQKKFSTAYEQKLCQQVMESEYNIHANSAFKNRTAILKVIQSNNLLYLLSQDKRDLSKLLFANRNSLDSYENKEILALYTPLLIGVALAKVYVDIKNDYYKLEKKYPVASKYTTLLKLFLIKTTQKKAAEMHDQEAALFAKKLNKKLCLDDPFCALAQYQEGLAKFNKAKKNNNEIAYHQALHYWLKAAQLGDTNMLDTITTLKNSPTSSLPVIASCDHILLAIPEKNRQQLPQPVQDALKQLIQKQTETKEKIESKEQHEIHDLIKSAYQTSLFDNLPSLIQNMPLDQTTVASFLSCLHAEYMANKTALLERIANNKEEADSLTNYYQQYSQTENATFLKYMIEEYCKKKNPHAAYLRLLLSSLESPTQKIKQNKSLRTFINHPTIADAATSELLEVITNHLTTIAADLDTLAFLKEFNFSAAGLAARLLKQASLPDPQQKKWATVYLQNFARTITQSVQSYQDMFSKNKEFFNQLYHDVISLNKEQLEMPASELDIFQYYYGIINNKMDLVTDFLEKQKKENLLQDNVLAYCASQKELNLFKNDPSPAKAFAYMEKLKCSLLQGNADAYLNYLIDFDKYRTYLEKNIIKLAPQETWLTPVITTNPRHQETILYSWLVYLVNNKRFNEAYTLSFKQQAYPISLSAKILFISSLLQEAFDTIDSKTTVKLCAAEMKHALDHWQKTLTFLQSVMILYGNDLQLFAGIKNYALFDQLDILYKTAHKEDVNRKYTKDIQSLLKWQIALQGYQAFIDPSSQVNKEDARKLLAVYTNNPYTQAHLYLALTEHFLQRDIALSQEFCKKGEESALRISNGTEKLEMLTLIMAQKNVLYEKSNPDSTKSEFTSRKKLK